MAIHIVSRFIWAVATQQKVHELQPLSIMSFTHNCTTPLIDRPYYTMARSINTERIIIIRDGKVNRRRHGCRPTDKRTDKRIVGAFVF